MPLRRCRFTAWPLTNSADCSDDVGNGPTAVRRRRGGVADSGRPAIVCPAGSFKCSRAPLCIPAKWQCDGGDDCQDGDIGNGVHPSDEDPAVCNAPVPPEGHKPPPPAALVEITSGGTFEQPPPPVITTTDSELNAFGGLHADGDTRSGSVQQPPNLRPAGAIAAVTDAPPPPPPPRLPVDFTFPPVPPSPDSGERAPPLFEESFAPPTLGQCTDEERRVVTTCMAAPFIEAIDGDVLSAFGDMNAGVPVALDPTNGQKLSQVCSVFAQLKICLGTLMFEDKDCLTNTVASSKYVGVEMYSCQLVVPALQDDNLQSCLTAPACIKKITSGSRPGQERGPVAQGGEMCNFLSTVRAQLDCSLPQADCSTNEILVAVLSETQAFEQSYGCDMEAAAGPATAATPKGCPLEQLIFASCVSHIAQLGQLAETNERDKGGFMVPPGHLKKMCTGVAGYKQCRDELTGGNDCPLSASESRLFASVDPVVSVFCGADLIAQYEQHVDCLEGVAGTDRGKQCEQQSTEAGRPATACDTIGNLDTSVDCIKAVAVGMCPEAKTFLDTLQQRIDQQVISNKCFDEYPDEYGDNIYGDYAEDTRPKFNMTPQIPPCNEEQDLKGAGCLFGLLALSKEFPKFRKVDMIVEISKNDSELLNNVCTTYGKFDVCTHKAFAMANDGERCAFGSPLITAARVGLSQFCDNNTQAELQANRWCMEKLKGTPEMTKCSEQLKILGPMIQRLLSESNPALVCEIFYKIRNIFDCTKGPVLDTCGAEPLKALEGVQMRLSQLAIEEGCPAERPDNFDAYLVPPPTKRPKTAATAAPDSLGLNTLSPDYFDIVDQPTTAAPGLYDGDCTFEGQQHLFDCLTPMVELEGHPFLLVEEPSEVSQACDALASFQGCRHNVQCRPGFVEGTLGSWSLVCGSDEGRRRYDRYSGCLKTVADIPQVGNCTRKFVSVSEQSTCASATELFMCTKPHLAATCDAEHEQYLAEFLSAYGSAQGETCDIVGEHVVPVPPVSEPEAEPFATNGTNATVAASAAQPEPEPEPAVEEDPKPLTPIACSDEEVAAIDKCQAAASQITDDLKHMFKGGLQGFVTKAEELGELFARGCDVGERVKQCVAPVVNAAGTECQVSSCLIRAGDGICDQADAEAAINGHLKCVFQLVTFQPFARCLGLLVNNQGQQQPSEKKEVSLEELRRKLTPFLRCAAPVIRKKCGREPMRVLRALAADKHSCPLDLSDVPVQPFVVPEPSATAEPVGVAEPEPTSAPVAEPEPLPTVPPVIDVAGSAHCSANAKLPVPCEDGVHDDADAKHYWYYHPLYHMCLVLRSCDDVASGAFNVFRTWSECADACIPQDSFQCAFRDPPATDDNGDTIVCGPNVPNASECPESHTCTMGAFFGICCNSTLQEHFQSAVRPQCGDGTPAIPFSDGRMADFQMPILGTSCGVDSPCNSEHVCYHNGVFSYCCTEAKHGDCDSTRMQAKVEHCVVNEIQKRRLISFEPWALIKQAAVEECQMVDAYDRCLKRDAEGCDAHDQHPATRMHRMLNFTCGEHAALWGEQRQCLRQAWRDAYSVKTFTAHTSCSFDYETAEAEISWHSAQRLLPDVEVCNAVKVAVECAAQEVIRQCGADALAMAVDAMRLYAGRWCEIDVPEVKGRCQGDQVAEHMGLCADTDFSQWRLEPITLAVTSSDKDIGAVCDKYDDGYADCMDSLDCAPGNEHVAIRTTFLYACGRLSRQRKAAMQPCIVRMIETDAGRKCIAAFNSAWQFASDQAQRNTSLYCDAMNAVLSCASADANIYRECGMSAVIRMYESHRPWVEVYHKYCNVRPPSALSSLDVCQGVECDDGQQCSKVTVRPTNCNAQPCPEYTCGGGSAPVPEPPFGTVEPPPFGWSTGEPTPPPSTAEPEPEPEASAEPEPEPEPENACKGKCSAGQTCVPEPKQCVRPPCPQYVCYDAAGLPITSSTAAPEPEPEPTTEAAVKPEPEPTTEPSKPEATKKPKSDPDTGLPETAELSAAPSLTYRQSVFRLEMVLCLLLLWNLLRVRM